MIRLQWQAPSGSVESVQKLVQMAVDVEFGTLPPYLYAMMSIPEGENTTAFRLIKSVALEEMIHMCLACNILNAIGGSPNINPPKYPGPLPGSVGEDHGKPLILHLYPFSEQAMQQASNIELPADPLEFPDEAVLLNAADDEQVTIGEFYARLDALLKALPDSAWHKERNQINDKQFFQGQIFPVNNYDDAHRAIENIVSEGEGSPQTAPLDFQNELAHYYRFEELRRNRVLTKANNEQGYVWGDSLGVDWSAVYPAIADPESHDYSGESAAAQAAQLDCNSAFSDMVDDLYSAFNGTGGDLGNGVRAMFDLRMAAIVAFNTPLNSGKVAGPSFLYIPQEQRSKRSTA